MYLVLIRYGPHGYIEQLHYKAGQARFGLRSIFKSWL